MSVPLTPGERISTVRRLYRGRPPTSPELGTTADPSSPSSVCGKRAGRRRRGGEAAYLAYLVVLILALVVVPLLLGIASVLAQPEILQPLTSAAAPPVVGIVAGCFLSAAAVAGMHRGPAHLPPLLVSVLAGNDLPRSRTLARSFIGSCLGLTMGVTTVATLLSVVLVRSGPAGTGAAAAFIGGAACLGALAATAWLAGQRVGPRRGWLLPVLLLGATVLTALVPQLAVVVPWGWVADLWPVSSEHDRWALVPLVLLTLVCLDRVPRLLNRLHGPLLLDQASRWEVVGTATYTGDVAVALAMFRSRPRMGRSWSAVTPAPAPLRYAVRDLIGAVRTPVRAMTGLFFLVAGGFLVALAVAETALPAWLLVTLGAVAVYSALGTVTDGFRHTAQAHSAPTLYGYRTAELFGLHAVLPVLVATVGTLAGALVALSAGWGAGLWQAWLLGILLVAVRAYDSTKGMLPLVLLTPSPSPVGDMSSAMVLAWQADALLIAVGLGVALTAPGWAPGVGALVATVAAALVLGRTAGRLREA